MDDDGPGITGASVSIVAASLYIACGPFVVLYPDATLSVLNDWAHGIDLLAIKRPASDPIPMSGWIPGLVTISATAFVAGTLFGWVTHVLRRIVD